MALGLDTDNNCAICGTGNAGVWVCKRCTKILRSSAPSASNTGRDAIIAEAVEAWREWDALSEKLFTDRLVNAMHALSDYESDNSAHAKFIDL